MYERYCELRDSKGYKDADIAKGTGITRSTFTDWKNGRSIPKPPKLQKIADYLDVSLSYLMTGIEETLPENQKLNERDKRDIAKDLDRIMMLMVLFFTMTSLFRKIKSTCLEMQLK